jgi:cysteine-rich repeat protein
MHSPSRGIPALLVLLAAAQAGAADRPVQGDRLLLRDHANVARRAVRFTALRDLAVDPTTGGDPRTLGATLEVTGQTGGDGSSGSIALAASRWVGIGAPPGSKGYKYVDGARTVGITLVILKAGKFGGTLRVVGGGGNWPYLVGGPQGGPIDVRLTIGGDVYCARFTSFDTNQVGKVEALNAAAPASCAAGPGPTCGDGTVQGTEECDDGDTDSGDGCSATCQLEDTSALCAGVPSVSGTSLGSIRVASGLSSPVHITAPRLDPNRLFIVEQDGRIRIIKNGVLLATPFLAIEGRVGCCGERGLLSLAFHPDYENNGFFFVYYTDNGGDVQISRFSVSGNPDQANAGSELSLLTIEHSTFGNHNGGQLAFGPDGYLYAAIGDGGSGGDPFEAGQDDTTLLGKQLRIDVDDMTIPAVPPSNPNAGAGLPLGLIWAKGLRNPWRFSFDRGTGDLYIADVGQNAVEEVDFQPAASTGGLNYGWDIFEGSTCYEPLPLFPTCPAPPTGYTMPVTEYSHAQGCSITGGFVYRGCRMPDMHGTYFYSDLCSAFIRTFQGVSGGVAQNEQDRTADVAPGGGLSIGTPVSFGEDARGELYISDYDGEIYKIVP